MGIVGRPVEVHLYPETGSSLIMAKVYLKFDAAIIKEIRLTKDETTFGRKPTNDIVIDHATVSGFHGKIVKSGDGYVVEDLNSTNGTFINGNRIKTGVLKDRDQIGVARHILEFFAADDPLPPAPPKKTFNPEPIEKPMPSSPSQPNKSSGAELEIVHGDRVVDFADVAEIPGNLSSAARQLLQKKEPPATAAPETPAASEPEPAMPEPALGFVRIVSGAATGQTEIKLKDLVTYIGTGDKAAIKIKGFLAPDLAAAISRRPEGYFLKAVKSGYPKVNGNPVREQIFLEHGSLIEVGGTNMVFYQSDSKKAASA
jgi:predicted component of type VI protein secretion system